MLDPLAFKAVNYGIAGLLVWAALVLSVASLKIETVYGRPVNGLFSVVLIIAALCILIVLLTAYVQLRRPVSILLRWEKAAFTAKE